MSKTIRIPSELFIRLEKHAKGFDTPASVIERILDSYEGVVTRSSSTATGVQRDKTKYRFNNHLYGKGRLVLAVVKKYASDHPGTTFDGLANVFPATVQGPIGVFNLFDSVQEKYSDKQHKRHFVKPDEIIKLADSEVVVCTEWGIGNINDFLRLVKEIGYEVIPTETE